MRTAAAATAARVCGLVVDTETTHATGTAEREAAEVMVGDVAGRQNYARLGQGLRCSRGEAA
jgi:hypothetical protein